MINSFQNIYARMADELSKLIYMYRLNYSITQDGSYIDKMVEHVVRSRVEWNTFCQLLKQKAQSERLYLFGAGVWGRTLYYETKNWVTWQGVIDKRPVPNAISDIDIMTLEQFLEKDERDAVIVVSSYKYGTEILEILQKAGIPEDKIINGGNVIYSLTEGAIYFDLKELESQLSEEVFIDAGGFDGATTRSFLRWCRGRGYAYCFEADLGNISKIKENLSDCRNCQIIPKALWSDTASLSMHMKGNCASTVTQAAEGEDVLMIEAVALDDLFDNETITFIKMDIEGAELDAIRGAKKVIQKQHPRLAVSIYHKMEDIWTIPCLLMEYYPGYKFYMRHYSFADYDTVLYALP